MKISGNIFLGPLAAGEKFLVHSVAMMTKARGVLLSMDGDGAAAGRDNPPFRAFRSSALRGHKADYVCLELGTPGIHDTYTSISALRLCKPPPHSVGSAWGVFMPASYSCSWALNLVHFHTITSPFCEPCRIETLSIRQTAHGARTCGTRSSHLNLYVGEFPLSTSFRDQEKKKKYLVQNF